MRKVIRFLDRLTDRILALVFLTVFLIGLWFLYDTAYVYRHASAGRVAAFRPGAASEKEPPAKQLTKDYVAWLTVDDTNINYPVMQGRTNSDYLNTDPYGEYSLAGSIFLDSRNAGDFSDDYSLIYGHHMAGGFMFGALDRYEEEAYFDAHRTGTLTVGERALGLEAFAVLLTDSSEAAVFQLQGREAVLRLARERALYYREPAEGRVLALSTCADDDTARMVVLFTLSNGGEEGS